MHRKEVPEGHWGGAKATEQCGAGNPISVHSTGAGSHPNPTTTLSAPQSAAALRARTLLVESLSPTRGSASGHALSVNSSNGKP